MLRLGVPFKLLKEFTSRKITIETCNGDVFKGELLEAEENMSLSLSSVKVTFVDGKTTNMENVYVKGSRIRLINLPDTAKESIPNLCREQRGGFRGGRGGFRGRRGGRGGRSSGRSSYDSRR